MPISASSVAEALLYEARRKGILDVSNLKLQKLLYETQGYHLALFGDPAFREDLKSWRLGAVVPEIYHDYRGYGHAAIDRAPASKPKLPSTIYDAIGFVLQDIGQLTAFQLSNRNHAEPAWETARATGHSRRIDLETMKTSFLQKPSIQSRKPMTRNPANRRADLEGDLDFSKVQYRLEDLAAAVTAENRHNEFGWGPPVGMEAL